MAEIKLGYTASQINNLLKKINEGATLTSDEKDKLLNINLDSYVTDENLAVKVQDEITKSAAYSVLRNSTTRVILGRYIIRYNDLENTLDFSYTDNDIIAANYEVGSIDDTNGQDKANTVCIRTAGYIEVEPKYTYSLYFLKPALYVKYYLYKDDGTFIKASTEVNPTTNDVIKMETTADTAYIRFKFGAPEQTVTKAFALADYIDLYKSLGTEVSSNGFEAGSMNTTTGVIETNTEAVRTANYIAVTTGNKYIVTVPESVRSFRFYYYDPNKNFINCTEALSAPARGSLTAILPSNAAYMKFKYISTDNTQSTALSMSSGVTVTSAKVEDITINWVEGEYDDYGVAENNNPNYCVRTENPIEIEPGHEYTMTFGGDVVWFRYYFYTSSGTFLNRSDSMDVSGGETITINPPSSAAKMTMKFGDFTSWGNAKAVADDPNTIFKKIEK